MSGPLFSWPLRETVARSVAAQDSIAISRQCIREAADDLWVALWSNSQSAAHVARLSELVLEGQDTVSPTKIDNDYGGYFIIFAGSESDARGYLRCITDLRDKPPYLPAVKSMFERSGS